MQSSYNLIPSLPPDIFESHLNILTNYNGRTDPMWKMRNCSQREYVEVEIFADENARTDLPFEKSMDKILNQNKYTCHICNIEVPKMYMKEHNESNKHKTCNAIANLALERTKLHMQQDVVTSRRVEVLDTYFCGRCSVVVLNSDKEEHEKNKVHKVSLKHDELLNDLLKIYLDRDNVEVKSEIDELDFLQQNIELEYLQEESESRNTDTDTLKNSEEEIDIKAMREEVWNVLKIEFQAAVDARCESVLSEVSEWIQSVKLETAMLKEKCNSINDMMKKNENLSEKLNSENFDNAKNQRKYKNKIFKKYLIQKQKKLLHNSRQAHALLENESVSNILDNNTLKNFDHSSALQEDEAVISENKNNAETALKEKESFICETSNNVEYKETIYSKNIDDTVEDLVPLFSSSPVIAVKPKSPVNVAVAKRIGDILSKYFNKLHTVDALHNSTDREYNKKIKEPKKTKEDRKKERDTLEQNIESAEHVDKKQIKNEVNATQNIENVEQDHDKELNKDNKQQKDDNIEHNNNNNILQNKNNEETKDNQEQNNNKKVEQNKNKKSNNQSKKKNFYQEQIIREVKEVSKQEVSRAPSVNLVYYLKDIAVRCQIKPIHTTQAITDTIIQITAINGDKIKVLVNNFHSFHAKAQDTYCKVCETPNVRRPEWHIIEAEHRTKVMIPIKDKNGIRQLDDIWSHCILCNDLIKNVDFHLQSLLHKNKLKHCLVELGSNDTDSDDSHHNYEKTHVKSSREKAPVKDVSKKRNKHAATIAVLMLKNNLVMTSKNYLNCVVCDVIVNYDLTTVQQHVNSFEHLTNFERDQNENRLVDVDGERLYCIACDVNISKDEIVPHCNGRKHKKMLLELLKKQGDESHEVDTEDIEIVLPSISQNVKRLSKDKLEDAELICFVCNTILYCVDEHMDSFEHKKSYYTYLEANKLNEIEPDTFYCIPCNTVITIDYLMSHCTSRKHRITLKNFIGNGSTENVTHVETFGNRSTENVTRVETFGNGSTEIVTDVDTFGNGSTEIVTDVETPQIPSTSSEITYIVTPTLNVNDKTMPLKVLYQFREMTDSSKLFCTVCFEEVTYTRKQAEYHVSTLDHVVAFNLMMLWNKIKKRDDKYFCDICRLDMTYFSEITHVLGKQHANNLAKEPKGTVYEYDRTLVTHAYAMSHKVGSRTRPTSVISVAKPKKK